MSSGRGNIMVLGMHRSGTSALSGLLAEMGAHFGPETMKLPPKAANPKGYWERWDVVAANDKLLAGKGLEWHRVSGYSMDAMQPRVDEPVLPELKAIVDDYQQHQPWFVKDPRISLTLPAWLPLLEYPVCILVLRDPLQIALSLESRGDCSPHVGLALWEVYTAAALHHTRRLPRRVVRFDDLLNAPQTVAQDLMTFFTDHGVSGMRLPSDEVIAAWLDQGLKRERISADEIDDIMNSGQKTLHDRLRDGSMLAPDAPEWIVSGGGRAALRSFEAQHLRMRNEITALSKTLNDVQLENQLVGEFKSEMKKWTHDLDRSLDTLENSVTWRLGQTAAALWAKLRGRKPPPTPLDRLRDIAEAQKKLQDLGKPGAS